MLLLLPPSETKRDGGDDSRALDLAALGFPRLGGSRRTVLAAVRSLGRNRSTMISALGLGVTQRFEVDRNRAVRSAPVMSALDRYTGVLYDALDTASLSPRARDCAAQCTVVHSALFGLLRADDLIPAYRLSHDSRLPGLSLRTVWSAAVSRELDGARGLVVDLRSEAYAALGPLPPGVDRRYLRVVADGADGRTRTITHFNKRGKGRFVREILESGIEHDDVDSLLEWARWRGIRLAAGSGGVLELTVEHVSAG